MPNLTTPPQEWLREHFEFEFCEECGGDAVHHTAVPFIGNWFGRCDYPVDIATGTLHPVVAAYRNEENS